MQIEKGAVIPCPGSSICSQGEFQEEKSSNSCRVEAKESEKVSV
jgi:hypothetical protein